MNVLKNENSNKKETRSKPKLALLINPATYEISLGCACGNIWGT